MSFNLHGTDGFYDNTGGTIDMGGFLMHKLFPGGDGGEDPSGRVAWETGELLKKQFKDWQDTFQPIEMEALNQISFNNSAVLPDALADARKGVDQSRAALRAYSALDDMHDNCSECEETMQDPACCEICQPFADTARLQMRAIIEQIGQ